ncbi:uncharacterized protein LOC121388603 [Gigantopelta aegis]|uniref:uncharacterized protein LOC121388603 n=1 Tax=Gigantopelta aegis TaxID=1735272 RepID=UPI001B88D397|nr:uncharacterized protein LOC121388603 [Gigantopelta aegis]XP_041375944.1 uncharacterized protein LOC121388603 [Gigantopelta aegis]
MWFFRMYLKGLKFLLLRMVRMTWTVILDDLRDMRPNEMWATHLSVLLKGRALDVYASMPSEQALNYNNLKEALLKRYDLTEDGFRLKFRTGKPETGETFQQFSVRLASYLRRWLEMSKTEHTFKALFDVIMRDQFVQICNRELALFLKERTPTTIDEMAVLADQFREARFTRAVNLTKGLGIQFSQNIPERKSKEGNGTTKISKPDVSGSFSNKRCFRCGKLGHIATRCYQKVQQSKVGCMTSERELVSRERSAGEIGIRTEQGMKDNGYKNAGTIPKVCGTCVSYTTTVTTASTSSECILSTSCDLKTEVLSMPTAKGWLGGEVVSVLRDTGCNGVVVRRCYIPDEQLTGEVQICMLADGSKVEAPIAKVQIDTPYYTGEVKAWCLEHPLYDLILGNIKNVREPNHPNPDWKLIQAVQTRQQKHDAGKAYSPLKVPEGIAGCGSPDEMKKAQEDDPTLRKLFVLAEKGQLSQNRALFYKKQGLLYRKFKSSKVENGKTFTQFVVPQPYRTKVLKLAHESIMSGHLGTKRTVSRILAEFFWSGVQAEGKRFCQSCDICQRIITKGRVCKVPLEQMPLIDEPFKRVAVDLVGPLKPATEKGNRYILTLVDYATRYPEAVALKGIEAERVAEALVDIFCRIGVPREMLTDMGTQFTSTLMSEVSRLISLKQLTTTPYHPMCNGLVGRFNGTLKQMLKRLCAERPQDWDKYLSAVLFAYREVPQESLGFSPFELVYGHSVRGPMSILKELWTKEVQDDQVRSTYQYVIDLRERLELTRQMAKENLEKSARRHNYYYNKKARQRNMKVGEKVLVLLPTDNNKLTMQWKGPYTIKEKLGNVDYRLEVTRKIKTFHANMLKHYVQRENQDGVLALVNVAVIDLQTDEGIESHDGLVEPPSVRIAQGPNEVKVNSGLAWDQIQEVRKLLYEYSDVLSDSPGYTSLAIHDIRLLSDTPVRVKPHPLPFAMRDVVDDEVRSMLQMDIIEYSDSPYSSPIVIVKKKDGTNRFCIDFRRLNKITIFDAEPMPNADEIFAKLNGCRYISKLDLSKGYWQLPLTESAKGLTAFQTPMGLFQFKVMPFGLVNAPASFSRLMRKLLQDMQNIDNFIDDIIIYTTTFGEHMQVLKELLIRLRNANLTAKPSKCYIGFQSLECLGHIVGNEKLEPVLDKVKAIKEAKQPETKKQVK